MPVFGEVLKGLREKAGYSQRDLADRSGISQKSISGWETGSSEPTLSNIQKLCAALGVDCTVFFDAGDVRPAAAKRARKK